MSVANHPDRPLGRCFGQSADRLGSEMSARRNAADRDTDKPAVLKPRPRLRAR